MKNRFVVASLTAFALVTLSACGSTVQGAAVGGVGVGQTSAGPIAPSDISTGTNTGAPDTGSEQSTPGESTPVESTPAETTPAETTEETTRSTGGVDLETCKAVTDFATAFATMLQKIQSGPITQEDVDGVFTDEVQAALPESAQANYTKLKELSNKLVGKSLTELADVATELTDAANDLQAIIKSACGVG
ncbi:MAG: hypothetical protein WKF57_15240 [Nakamurella sp.]